MRSKGKDWAEKKKGWKVKEKAFKVNEKFVQSRPLYLKECCKSQTPRTENQTNFAHKKKSV